jgi:peptidoglycan hydrolase-like protein with peptidoglycan-binding domain
MRVLILTLSVLGILVGVNAAKAGLITAAREVSVSVEPSALTDEATQQTEDQIGLNKGKRRDVQRRLNRLGFDTKATGKFGEKTRAAITRWQEAHGYPTTGFLNATQHDALLTENVSAAHASAIDETDSDHPTSRRGGGVHRHRGGVGGPVGLIGGMVGGIFGRR